MITSKWFQDRSSEYYFLSNYKPDVHTINNNAPFRRADLDIYSIRKDFPILQTRVNGKSLVWLDNSATTQKPKDVINTLEEYYSKYNSNIHRGAHTLAKISTDAYETAREKIRLFIGASSLEEIIFVRGTTEGINLVTETFGESNIEKGDEIILSIMEHHSNIVPWQKLAKKKGATIKIIPVNECGELILEEYKKLLSPKTKIVAITQLSNILGTINPIKEIIEIAHASEAKVLVDGAQGIAHIGIDVNEVDADFYVFSGHKIYGPTGIGVLYGKKELLQNMPPYQRGGGMIKNVTFDSTEYNSLPYKFEAGTGNIADAIGLGAAIDYVNNIGINRIMAHEAELTNYAMERLSHLPGLSLIGTTPNKSSVISFILSGLSPDQAAHKLNEDGIAVRSGHHCAQPVLKHYGFNSVIRASIGIYNTREEIDILANSLMKMLR
ncbi:SufS family cysteine desulfurase [Alkalibaculum bacchi]|uniref:cysteine desulfurase n=1 Tax=Alkalibaculum bacchi TaxID=645887 RepID=A0A366HZS0_9FIRM|nr:cysteine desulfurase [Alkalibaculum bacchi]RBP59966.1 SufS family cysteine desulfurase [Alkalibaculum bacchi]